MTILSILLALAIATIIVMAVVLRDENKARERYEKWFHMIEYDNKVMRGAINEYKVNFMELKKKYENALIDLEEAKAQHNIDEWEIGHLEHQLDMAEDHIMRMQENM